MIGPLLAISLAGAVVIANGPTALDACLINLANAPEYVGRPLVELAADTEGFVDEARDSWCVDEVGDLWDGAHRAARKKLGVPVEGRPVRGQQELAETAVKSILADRLLTLEAVRAKPPALSPKKVEKLQLIWLLDQTDEPTVGESIKPPIKCVAAAASKDPILANRLVDGYGRASERLGTIGETCGYNTAVSQFADRLQGRFPDTIRSNAISVADEFLGQLLFWALLSSGQNS
jgi:hypothetical protein